MCVTSWPVAGGEARGRGGGEEGLFVLCLAAFPLERYVRGGEERQCRSGGGRLPHGVGGTGWGGGEVAARRHSAGGK